MSLIIPGQNGGAADIGSAALAYDANLQAFVTAFTLPTADGTVGQVLRTDGAGNLTFVSPATGTVTSVGLSVPTGFAVSGSPVTGSGTLALAFDTGYSLPTTASQTNWNTAFGWGNHATAGYLTTFTESDPVFGASPAAGITTQKITNWDTAFGWGNHASAGYLLSSTAASTYQPLDADLTAIAALAGTSGLLRKTAADTWSLDAATYLQSGAIGSTVLAYDANLQAFVTAFTLPTADGTSGQVLTTNGAGVISFATPSGGGSPTSPEIITTPSGTVYRFTQNTAPTERGAGVPLVAGDQWTKPTDNGIPGTAGGWTWTGSDWVSAEKHILQLGCEGASTTTTFGIVPYRVPDTLGSILQSISYSVHLGVSADASNYWGFSFIGYKYPSSAGGFAGGAFGAFAGLGAGDPRLEFKAPGLAEGSLSLNFLINNRLYNALALTATKTGSPSNTIACIFKFIFRDVHP